MIYIVEQEGKPIGAMRVDEAGVMIAIAEEQSQPVVIEAQGSLLPALVLKS